MRRGSRADDAPGETAAPSGLLTSLSAAWAPVVARQFELLEIGASIAELGPKPIWHAIHVLAPTAGDFERRYHRERDREAYNRRSLERVYSERRPLLGEHFGFNDWFAPLLVDGEVAGAIVCGPFLIREPSSQSIVDQWRRLTGQAAVADDPLFLNYLDTVLNAAVLTGDALEAFQELVQCLSRIIQGIGDPRALSERAVTLQRRAWVPTFERRMARAVAELIDERWSPAWSGLTRRSMLDDFGLDETPSDVAVVLVRTANLVATTPVERLCQRWQWQKECSRLAARHRGAACGWIAEHGVVFLTPARGSAARRRETLLNIAQTARDLAARCDWQAHAAIGPLGNPESLPKRFRACHAAAEQALSKGVPFADATVERARSGPLVELGALTQSVLETVRSHSAQIDVSLDAYLELVAVRSAYRPGVARAYLDALMCQLVQSLASSGILEPKAIAAVTDGLDSAVADTETLPDLLGRYKRAIAGLAAAVELPAYADQEAKLQKSCAFIQERFTERLRMRDAARIAGFAPAYYSRLFKRRFGRTFEQFLFGLRLERAQELLRSTRISVERVAQQSGFGSSLNFYRAFRHATGLTPSEFRSEMRAPARAQSDASANPERALATTRTAKPARAG